MGTHVTSLPGEALGCGGRDGEGGPGGPEQQEGVRSLGGIFPDAVIRGEPERTIRDLCSTEGEHRLSVKGISYRDPASGKAVHNPDAGFMHPEEIPAPAWNRLDLGPYRLPFRGGRFLITAPVRGCPYACSFCTAPAYYGRKVRKRPVDRVAEELRENVRRYGVRDFFFWAETFTVDRGYVLHLCEEILRQGLDISWSCNSRVDTVDPELLAVMKRAGLWMISFGIESGNQGVLESCGKGITVEQSVSAVNAAHEQGIRTAGHFLFGLPGETESSMTETLRLSLALPLDVAQYYAASPFPGTALYRQARRNGWLRHRAEFSQARAVMDLPGLPGREVDAFCRKAYRAFYTRPGTVLNMLGMLRPGGAWLLLRNAGEFLRHAMF